MYNEACYYMFLLYCCIIYEITIMLLRLCGWLYVWLNVYLTFIDLCTIADVFLLLLVLYIQSSNDAHIHIAIYVHKDVVLAPTKEGSTLRLCTDMGES